MSACCSACTPGWSENRFDLSNADTFSIAESVVLCQSLTQNHNTWRFFVLSFFAQPPPPPSPPPPTRTHVIRCFLGGGGGGGGGGVNFSAECSEIGSLQYFYIYCPWVCNWIRAVFLDYDILRGKRKCRRTVSLGLLILSILLLLIYYVLVSKQRELTSTRKTSQEHNNKDLLSISPGGMRVNTTKVHKLRQRHILKVVVFVVKNALAICLPGLAIARERGLLAGRHW